MPQKLIKVPKVKTGEDSQVAAQLQELFADAQNGMRRVVALGMFCYHVKSLLKKGEFQPWLAANCGNISYRSLAGYMRLTRNVLEACGVKTIGAYQRKCSTLHFAHGGELLLLPDAEVPEEARPLREKICTLIDGKSQRGLFLEFKQVDEDELRPKRGRRKGEGGASREQRAAARLAQEQAEVDEMEITAQDFCKWIDEVCDLKHLPRINQKVWDKLFERQKLLGDFMRSVSAARHGGAQ